MTRIVNLTATLDAYVDEQVGAKKYRDANEVMRQALRLMKEREAHIEWLKQEVAKGLSDPRSYVMNDELMEEIKVLGRKRWANRRRKRA